MQIKRNETLFNTRNDVIKSLKTTVNIEDNDIVLARYNGGSMLAVVKTVDEIRYWTIYDNIERIEKIVGSLPSEFVLNYNVKNMQSQTMFNNPVGGTYNGTQTFNNITNFYDDHITVNDGSSSGIVLSDIASIISRNSSNPTLTVISKARTTSTDGSLFANRHSTYNWMYRQYQDRLTLHGTSEQGSISITDNTKPSILSVTVDRNRTVVYRNHTEGTTSTTSSFNYGDTNSTDAALFWGFADSFTEQWTGDFYWIFISTSKLSDDEIKKVIAYNES